MATKYFFYDGSNNVETLLNTIPSDVTPVLFGTPESYDILNILQQGLPLMPFLATQNDSVWEITYFNEPYSW